MFPPWFVRRAVTLTLSLSKSSGPELVLRVMNVRELGEWDAVSWVYDQRRLGEVAVAEVQRQLEEGETSVVDVDQDGLSLLSVCQLPFLWSCHGGI